MRGILITALRLLILRGLNEEGLVNDSSIVLGRESPLRQDVCKTLPDATPAWLLILILTFEAESLGRWFYKRNPNGP